ncbi:hypothetical protein EPA93_21175 [Ktedonosporobacter rubrisoli]|uniref:Uncharacterized protein n=1 Tax=Ktedonosporobacter rubrisoli TaxID=2509675 RepID=A0A4P6JSW3_KTERU|nr:hypothetical protein [Ktedonosporobacter rubrisoli]QBD78373.1 hypothetical protein EPA93_21175 [Ktedonosporobacter rubrisoli]
MQTQTVNDPRRDRRRLAKPSLTSLSPLLGYVGEVRIPPGAYSSLERATRSRETVTTRGMRGKVLYFDNLIVDVG